MSEANSILRRLRQTRIYRSVYPLTAYDCGLIGSDQERLEEAYARWNRNSDKSWVAHNCEPQIVDQFGAFLVCSDEKGEFEVIQHHYV